MGNIDYIRELFSLIEDNPLTIASVGGAIMAVVGFFKPVALAARRMWIRRIDQAWPASGPHEERVRKTVDQLTWSRLPISARQAIENSVREHKSILPSTPPDGSSGQ